jgi:putative glutamine amidotransferase
MVKPLIAVIPDYDEKNKNYILHDSYVDKIEAAGGQPLIYPYGGNLKGIEQMVELFDGLCISGGSDINPELYCEEKLSTCGSICALRDKFEMMLVSKFIDSNKPVLGICRGLQILNVVLKGTLHQDIPSELTTSTNHRIDYNTCPHDVRVLKDTPLNSLILNNNTSLKILSNGGLLRECTPFENDGEGFYSFGVNSYHHQCIKGLSCRLMVQAVSSEDAVVESVYMPGKRFVMGFQWHPERLDNSISDLVFSEFVKSCSSSLASLTSS